LQNNPQPMAFTIEQIEELENYFASIEIPQTIKLHGAITYQDLPKFVEENLKRLKEAKLAPVVMAPRYDDLVEIKKALSKPVA